jgi:Tol biopolymer transport system component
VLFGSFAGGEVDLVRVDADGTNAAKLVSGDIGPPICSADGYVFYVNMVKPETISRIGVQGGAPVEIAKSPGFDILGRLTISPDARFLAFAYDEPPPATGTKLAVIPASGGPLLKAYEVPSDVLGLCWSPDGHRLQYLLTRSGTTNIWEQPLDGGQPRQLTTFSSGRIFDFNWSIDGKRLLLARGETSKDVVLLSNLH